MSQTVQPSATAGSSRIMALDLLRGYFILVIASIHLHRYPSLLGLFDGRGQLWISEAEGFFFISGLLIGVIRQRDAVRNGFDSAVRKLLSRGAKLYAASVVLTILYLIIGRLLSTTNVIDYLKDGLDLNSSWIHLLTNVLNFHYTYGWADFLIYYALYMFIAPLALWILRRGGWWLVVIISGLVWYLRWHGDYGWWNPYMQWQIYFFWGTALGFYWHQLTTAFDCLSGATKHHLQVMAVAGSALIYLGGMVMVFVPQHYSIRQVPGGWIGQVVQQIIGLSHNLAYNQLLVDGRLGLLRPILELIVFGGLFTLVRRYEGIILRLLGWLLVPFGSNSLYVYIIESALLFALPLVVHANTFVVNSLLEVGIIAITWLAIRQRFLFRIIPR